MCGRRRWAALAAAALGGCAVTAPGTVPAPGAVRPALTAEQLRHDFPNVAVRDQDGHRLHFYDDLVKGRKVLVYFMFTTCQGVCPGTTANLVRVQDMLGERFGSEFTFIGVTLTPQVDTPQALKAYAQAFGTKPGWTFLTGDKSDLETLRRRFGLVDPDPVVDADITQHAGVVVFGDEATGRWSALPGTMPPEEIVRTLLRRTRPLAQPAAANASPWVVLRGPPAAPTR
jgi:protein SCO1/2